MFRRQTRRGVDERKGRAAWEGEKQGLGFSLPFWSAGFCNWVAVGMEGKEAALFTGE